MFIEEKSENRNRIRRYHTTIAQISRSLLRRRLIMTCITLLCRVVVGAITTRAVCLMVNNSIVALLRRGGV